MAEVAVEPGAGDSAGLEGRDPPLERLGGVRAVGQVPDARLRRGRQLERRALVVAEAAQVDRVAALARDLHAEDLAEVVEALVGLRREQLDVGEVREVADRLAHARYPCGSAWRCSARRRRERHDRERRVDRERVRDERAVADVEPLDVPGLRVGIDDRALRVAAHAARPLHVRRDQPRPAHARGAGFARSTLRENSSAPSVRARSRSLKSARERLRAVLVDAHAAVVLVVRHREQADPAAEPAQRLDQRRAPHGAVLVLERRREADRILNRRGLDHEAAVLVVLVAHGVRGDRIDHVRVLRLVEQPVHEARRMEAEVAADQPAARAVGQPRAHQDLRAS